MTLNLIRSQIIRNSISTLSLRCRHSKYPVTLLLLALSSLVHAHEWSYTVRSDDNLWNIADKFLKKGSQYSARLQALNHIRDPKRIPPGTRIRIPINWLKYQPVPARVQSLQGQCEAFSKQQVRIDLTPGKELHSGDSIRCPKNANMTLEFADGSRVLIQQQSELELDTVSSYQKTGMVDTRLRLRSGYIDTQAQPKTGPGSRYEIITPSAIAAVRGTDFRVNAAAQIEVMRSEVLHGNVQISSQGVRRLVKQGYGVTVETGKPPSKPKQLLPPPDITGLAEKMHYLPLHFDWQDLQDTFQYRFQVSPDKRFETLIVDRVTTRSEIKIPDLADGDYILRLRGIDYSGLEGLDRIYAFSVDVRPEAPMPLNPKNGATSYQLQPKFWWSIPEQTVAYHFQLATDPEFTNPLIDQPDYEGSYIIPQQELVPGKYYWHIASYDDSAEHGPFSSTQSVTIKDKPAAPEAGAPGMEENQINFQWRADPEAAYYQFQLADDEQFAEFMIDQQLESNAFSMPLSELPPGDYYFRIKTVNQDNVAGPFSPVQLVEIPGGTSPYWYFLLLLVLIPILV